MNSTGISPFKMRNILLQLTLDCHKKRSTVFGGLLDFGVCWYCNTEYCIDPFVEWLGRFPFSKRPRVREGFAIGPDRMQASLPLRSHKPAIMFSVYKVFTSSYRFIPKYFIFFMLFEMVFLFQFSVVYCWYIEIQFSFTYYIILRNLAKLTHQLTGCHILKCYLVMCILLYS